MSRDDTSLKARRAASEPRRPPAGDGGTCVEVVLEPSPAADSAVSELADGPRVADGTQALVPGEVVIGKLMGMGEDGEALVDFPDNPARQPLPARSTSALVGEEHVGREVALLFEAGDVTKPIIMGWLRSPRPEPEEVGRPAIRRPATVELDGERLVLSAEREIVLRCGQSSITLTRAGKILLRGKYLLSRSAGVNRIKGGSVQIN